MPIALSVKVQEQSEPPRELGEGRGAVEAASWGGGGHGGSGVLPGGSAIYSHFSNLMISTLGLLAFYPGGSPISEISLTIPASFLC